MTRRLLPLIAILCLVLAGAVAGRMAWFYLSIPSTNAALTHFDTLIVLGNPCNANGAPGPEQRERVLQAVRQYQQGIAPHIIMSGGAAHNQWVEADCMKTLAVQQGVPADAILEDTRAQNTIDNIVNSDAIMIAHNWHSAEVVSSPSHLPRAALILQHYTTFAWRTNASRWPPEYHLPMILAIYANEIKDCWQIHTRGFYGSHPIPTVSVPQPAL